MVGDDLFNSYSKAMDIDQCLAKTPELLTHAGVIKVKETLQNRNLSLEEKLPELILERYSSKGLFGQLRAGLVEEVRFACEKLLAYAHMEKKPKITSMVKQGRNDLKNMTQPALATFAEELVSLIQPIKADLKDYFYQEENFNNLDDSTKGYRMLLNEKNDHKRKYTMSVAIVTEMEAAYRRVFDDLKILIPSFSREFPEEASYISGLLENKRKPASRKWSVMASITDTDSQPMVCAKTEIFRDEDGSIYQQLVDERVPIANIKEKPICTKITTKNGVFICHTLEPGSYTVHISMNGYKSVVLKMYINPMNTFKIDVQLVKLS